MAQLQWLVETDPMIHGLLVDDIGKLEALKSSNDPQISQAADQIWPSVKQALVSRNKGEMTCQRYVN
jgi:hypothetical protein